MLRMNVPKKTKPKLLINLGACLDIPSAAFITGKKGESILNAGLGQTTGIVGAGNNFKSMLIHYMMVSAADKMAASGETSMHTYDTEVNIDLDRLNSFGENCKYLPKNLIFEEEAPWTVVDKSAYSADAWASELLKPYLDGKSKDKKLVKEFTAFKDPYVDKPLSDIVPTFIEIDSMSEFESATTMDMLANSTKDDSSTNTLFMRQGLFKTKFFAELPRLMNQSNTYLLTTAQIGDEIDMGGMYAPKPTKKLQHLKNGDKIKGVSGKFFFLLSGAWQAHTASILKNQATKLPEYPKGEETKQETDLNTVRLTMLRNKHGASGFTVEIVVSQKEGVLPALTEFHHIKSNNKFGITGSNISYALDLRPDTKLSRTTVREKLETDPLLARACNITSEMLQIEKFHPQFIQKGLTCTPKELYDDIKAMGYDWDELLDTRGWWTIDQYNKDLPPFLSTMDLLKMRKGLYVPYWLSTDSIKKIKLPNVEKEEV